MAPDDSRYQFLWTNLSFIDWIHIFLGSIPSKGLSKKIGVSRQKPLRFQYWFMVGFSAWFLGTPIFYVGKPQDAKFLLLPDPWDPWATTTCPKNGGFHPHLSDISRQSYGLLRVKHPPHKATFLWLQFLSSVGDGCSWIIPIKTDGRESPTLIPCKNSPLKYHQIVGVNHREIPRKLSRSRTWKRGNAWRITRF